MKTLAESLFDSKTQTAMESLFDSDLVQKDIPERRLVDLVFYDGEEVKRLKNKYGRYLADDAGIDNVHGLGVIDWKKVKKDLKKYKGENIDLGNYSHWNSDPFRVRNTETIKKTEMFARLILCLPFYEECNLESFNSRWRDEFGKILDEYISGDSAEFQVATDHIAIKIILYSTKGSCATLASWEFLKLIK